MEGRIISLKTREQRNSVFFFNYFFDLSYPSLYMFQIHGNKFNC